MKHKLMTIVFCAILLAGFVLNVITPDKEISFTERRPLDQMPELNKEFIFSKNTGEVLEEYLLDQFWNRDGVRSLKVWVDRNILRKTDVNGLYQIGEHLFKMDYPISENSVIKAGEKMLAIQEKFFGDTNQVAFSMIPDKAHYAPNKDKYLSLDYKKMMQLLEDTLTQVKDGGATRIPAMGCIDLESACSVSQGAEGEGGHIGIVCGVAAAVKPALFKSGDVVAVVHIAQGISAGGKTQIFRFQDQTGTLDGGVVPAA
ncbi:MAG: hypothetical protein IJ994_03310, partial [Firmicutes bacterium]|nr:hypothetical protein [Bacillota bacterium]